MNHSLHLKISLLLTVFLIGTIQLTGQEASGTISVTTENGEPAVNARVYIYSCDDDSNVLDSLLTSEQGTASFSGLNLVTGLTPMETGGRDAAVYPNPGSAHRIVVKNANSVNNPDYATIYNLSGQVVAQPKAKLVSPTGRLAFTWKPAEAKTPGGIYLFRYGATTARINHQKNAPSVSGNLPTSNLKPET